MSTKMAFYQFESNKNLSEVKEAVRKSLSFLGGITLDQGDTLVVNQGVNGVNFAFTATFQALVGIRQTTPNKYEIMANIKWSPNALFWICLVIGFFIFGILWIIPILYLFIDPTNAYSQALYRVPNFLGETASQAPLLV
jgi:hypothetical protein